ncbi:MAG: WD40 repeat domain-containing protein [Heteroscytonema crispum UTEX LB 1556]
MTLPNIFCKALTAITLTTSVIITYIHLYPAIGEYVPNTQQINQAILTLSGHTAPVRAIALTPDAQILASGGDDKTIKLWNLKTGELLRSLNGHTEQVIFLAISFDGKTLVREC